MLTHRKSISVRFMIRNLDSVHGMNRSRSRYGTRGLSFVRNFALPPICFTERLTISPQECQSIVDKYSMLSISLPVLLAASWVVYLLRPIPQELIDKGEVFTDPETGVVFQGADGAIPEKDKKGELVFKAIGFTPWPVAENDPGERIRIPVGKVGETEPRTYVFSKVKSSSKLINITLPRPLGLVFAEDVNKKRVVVEGIIPQTHAAQRHKIGQLSGEYENSPMVGDILRAITTVNFVYPTDALLGMNLPERHWVLHRIIQ
eukprot:g847.t1